jgi:D-threo-aldose 1-dehydrogenase
LFNYAPATSEVMERVSKLEKLCHANGVSLASAALQFPLRHPAVASVVVGMRSRAEVLQNAARMNEKIDDGFWGELDAALEGIE